MSASDAARRLREKFKLGRPPGAHETTGNLLLPNPVPSRPGRKRKAEKMAQLNLRVPEETKDRVRVLAARDRIEMSQVVMEAIELYEAKYGVAPKLEPSRRSE
jgi:hypothetical protein